ncbi:MAG: hypothetical protein AVDCRST_MAG65-2329 [uncultured Solirubrobacteraceae bacterium]|uniref:Uncharacterized protein n=1 Tax=uncultured Solirubrobacteraceae bacterium TaxID=1162706 RepID=A0A6J4SE01_9ACTN|nr:MAG: hypothetical protein AVDCRST_MAG65-2329 [uncultured Solirubrobacteraceae bacterium]
MSDAGPRRWLLAATLAVVLAACGQASPDLFAVTRSGDGPADDVTLVVNDGGTVTCNGGSPRQLGGDRLLAARELTRELAAAAELQLELPPGPDPMLFYRVESEAGTVSFSDASRNRPAALDRLVGFVSDVAENVCGIER